MDKKIFKSYRINYKEVEDEERTIEAIGSKQIEDRDKDIVYVDGINLKNYKENPIVLFAHDHRSLPIGRAEKVWKDGKELKFKIKFTEPEVNPVGDTVYKLIKGNYLNALSIGFIPDYSTAKYSEKRGGYDYYNSELLEVSIVPVPSNPKAVVTSKQLDDAVSKGVIDDLEKKDFEIYLNELLSQKEEVVEEKVSELPVEKEQINTKETICSKCGQKIFDCKSTESQTIEDTFDWLYKEYVKTPENKDVKEDLVDKLLKDFGF
jgi:HK97 family phage prohead protease